MLINAPYNDRTSTNVLLKETGLLSVNQLAASIKMCEVWKAENVPNYPVQLEPNQLVPTYTERSVRPTTNRKWNQDGDSTAAKLWNSDPLTIKTAKNLNLGKKKKLKNIVKCYQSKLLLLLKKANGLDKSWSYERLRWRQRTINITC